MCRKLFESWELWRKTHFEKLNVLLTQLFIWANNFQAKENERNSYKS